MTLHVGFAGTPEFAAVALRAIVAADFTVPLVITRPDKPKGRGLKVEPSEVAADARRLGLTIEKPLTLRTPEARKRALTHSLDVLVVAAYGLILPPDVLEWPRHGCLNIHASLLPRWRGAAPIQRAVEAGDAASGVTVMQMDAGLDTGPIVASQTVTIGPRETAGTLSDKLAAAGSALIVATLRQLERDERLEATPQPEAGVCYGAKIARDEARIDWGRDAASIDRQIRAFDPSPGAFGRVGTGLLKVWRAEPLGLESGAPPGTIVSATPSGIDVACGSGRLRILEVQPAGGRRMSAAACVAGRFVAAGSSFVVPA